MSYTDSRGFTDSQDNQKDFNEKYFDSNPGPYIATVKTTADPLRMGRLGVNIPALTNTTDPKPNNITWCQYLSPFYGVKSLNATSSTDPYSFKDTQQSYGMWAVPPDIDTSVLVIFAKGDNQANAAFWIGCIQDPMTNQMVPGNGSSVNTRTDARGVDFGTTKQQEYGTDFVPAGEKNRKLLEGDVIANANKWNYPINEPLADQLTLEGLIQDDVRGTTSSSARRESPSQVFGINTPGRIKEDSQPKNIGLGGAPVPTDRDIGHSFVMDDGAQDGTNQLTRIRTASGHQLLMHDTEGVVYLANGSGKAFIEMARDGTISVYSANGIDFRSGTDFNIHSDTNINFHAKGQINFTSEGNLALNAEGYLFAMGQKGILASSQGGSIRNYAKDGITSHTDGIQFHSANGRIDLAGSQVHLNSVGPRSVMGPGWLKPDAIGIRVTGGPGGLIDIDDVKPFRPFDAKIDESILPPSNPNQREGASAERKNEGLQPNKKENKTTVSDFVTHEPYDRKSSQARKKTFINEAIAEIRKSNPEMSATDIQQIKAELLKQPTVAAVADKLGKVIKLNDNIKLPIKDLNTLVSRANTIQNIINDPKAFAMNFVYGKLAEVGRQVLSGIRSKFNF